MKCRLISTSLRRQSLHVSLSRIKSYFLRLSPEIKHLFFYIVARQFLFRAINWTHLYWIIAPHICTHHCPILSHTHTHTHIHTRTHPVFLLLYSIFLCTRKRRKSENPIWFMDIADTHRISSIDHYLFGYCPSVGVASTLYKDLNFAQLCFFLFLFFSSHARISWVWGWFDGRKR